MKTIEERPQENLREFAFKHGGVENVFRSVHQGQTEGHVLRDQFVEMLDQLGYCGDPLQDFMDIDADCDGKISLQDMRVHLGLIGTMATTSTASSAACSTFTSDVEAQRLRTEIIEVKLQMQRAQEDQQLQHKALVEVLTSRLNQMAAMLENAVDSAVTKHSPEHIRDLAVAMPLELAERLERQEQTVELLRSKLESMAPDKDILDRIRRQADDLEALRGELDKRLSDAEISSRMASQSLLVEALRTHMEKRVSTLERCFCELSGATTPARSTLPVDCKKDETPPRSTLAEEYEKVIWQGSGSCQAPIGGSGGASCRVPPGADTRSNAVSGATRDARSGARSPPPSPMPPSPQLRPTSIATAATDGISCRFVLQDASQQIACDKVVDNFNNAPDSIAAEVSNEKKDFVNMARHQCTSPIKLPLSASNAASRDPSRSSTGSQQPRAAMILGGAGTPRASDTNAPIVRLGFVGYRKAAVAGPPRKAAGGESPRMSPRRL